MDGLDGAEIEYDWSACLDAAHFKLEVPDNVRYGAKPSVPLKDKQADRVEDKIVAERERIERQLGPRTPAEQRIIDAANLILIRRQDIRHARNRERRFETPSKYYSPAEDPELSQMQRPIFRGLYDMRLRPVKYYMGHKPGDFIFRYYHLPCLPFRDRRRWVYEGRVPHLRYEYDARLLNKLFPEILEALLCLMKFDENNPSAEPPDWILETQSHGRVALAEPKVQSRIVQAWKKTVKGHRREGYIEILHGSHLVQEMAWLYKRGEVAIPPKLYQALLLIMPDLGTVYELSDKHDEALEEKARELLFDGGEGWRVVDPDEESRRAYAKTMKQTLFDWQDYSEEKEQNEQELDCSQVLVYTLHCDNMKPCEIKGGASPTVVHVAEAEGAHISTSEKPLRDSQKPGPNPCDRHFLLQPQHPTPPRFSRCAIHEHHNKLRLEYGPDHGYYSDERYADQPTVPERVNIAGLAVQIARSSATRNQDEADVGFDFISGSSSSDSTVSLGGF